MSMMVSFVLSFFPRDVLDEILNLIESVSEDFPSYSCAMLHIIILYHKSYVFSLVCSFLSMDSWLLGLFMVILVNRIRFKHQETNDGW